VKVACYVATPPAKPLIIFDGDCNFCGVWIRRWRHITGDRVDYLPFRDPSIPTRFPEIPREQLETAVHLIDPDGTVYTGAEAAFRALAHNPHEQWLLDWYIHSRGFSRTSERVYRFVASHRALFSTLTRWLWGEHVDPPQHFLVRSIFLRSLAIIYLIAFISLWTQIIGLVGQNGILPAQSTMESLHRQVTAANISLERYHLFPTLCWFSDSDRSLQYQCALGVLFSVLLLVGVAPAPCLLLLWLIYLSLSTICREFLGFQWDILLLETGFLAIFFAPLTLLPGWVPRTSRPVRVAPRAAVVAAPSRTVLWLLRWLLFCLMFQSGCVKLLSGDPTWHNVSALTFHYETQPLPTWIGWYAHQLPAWFQKASTALMFAIELAVPFLIFTPRRPRFFACATLVAFQIFILLTGNYCFFNPLTIILCFTLLDDAALNNLLPKMLHRFISPRSSPLDTRVYSALDAPLIWLRRVTNFSLACLLLGTSLIQFSSMFRLRIPWPKPIVGAYEWLSPFRTFSNYGLFAVMTTSRPEIIIEGSNDGVTWLEYEFKFKPGDVKRRLRFVAPHQPRLDWQMWFAALSDYRRNPWFVNFCLRLLQGSPEVLALLERNPFPDAPPRYIRAVVYNYHFTDFATRRKTGAWWRREPQGDYLPTISLRHE
jgi:predicted DCC family thiol-disulfide oxidoreductase YuxK